MYPKADVRLLHAAYEVAEREHRGQQRTSGEPFITHPVAVATILAELGMDTTTLVAALLHDTVEDTGYTLEQTREDFGDEITHLVDGVTKLDKMEFGHAAEAETIRKMIVAMALDLRVLIIKLADRLHNMRTLRFQPAHKQQRTARATLEVLAPLANRLGLQVIRRDLEDLAFATLYPAEHDEIVRVVDQRDPGRREHVAMLVRQIAADLRSAKTKATVTPHPRHYYSIYQTMLERGSREIHDPDRILVVVAGGPSDCYIALGAVHGRWHPVPGRFKDFIAAPKLNGYQSLHTGVIGPGDEPVEVHIRTEAMHRTAEYGVVAQAREAARSRRANGQGDATGNSDDLVWLHRLLDWQRAVSDPGEFLESLRSDLSDHEVLVFTPKGDALTLPAGATPVDMAYALRTELGHHCIGARVNGQLVPAGQRPGRRGRGRDPHLQRRVPGPLQGVARLRQEPPGARQDPPVAGLPAPRRRRRRRPAGHRPVPVRPGLVAPAGHGGRLPGHARLRRPGGDVPGRRPEPALGPVGRPVAGHRARDPT